MKYEIKPSNQFKKGEKWDPRTLGARPSSSHEKYLRVALEIGVRL